MPRVVRVTPDFFRRLDAQLPPEREEGIPSRSDFETRELVRIVETFADCWDDLPRAYVGHEGYRVLVVAGQVVRFISVVGQLAPDGAVELVRVTLDLSPFPEPDDET